MFSKKNNEEPDQPVKNRSIEEIQAENEILFKELTNKNKDYFVQLDRRLDELAYDTNKKTLVLNQMFIDTIDFQKDAITARRMYGTVTERADKILGLSPEFLEGQPAESPSWMLYMDGALLLGGLFSVINGFGAWRSLSIGAVNNLNLVQFILNFALGGLVAMALTKYRPQPGKTEGMLKYTAVTITAIFAFVLVMTAADYIVPSVINPILPPLLVIGIGVGALVLRWYLKKKLNIVGTLF